MLTLDGKPNSLFVILDNLDLFRIHPVNCSKTKIVGIASRKFSKQVFNHIIYKLDFGSTTFVLLRIFISVKLQNITELNYNIILPKIITVSTME